MGGVSVMIIKTCLLSLSFALFIGSAAAQTRHAPIANGRQPQPTERQVESREGYRPLDWDVPVRSDIDRLYDEIMRAATPQRR
jgi:hypothetical protein